jgi:eukaryotic-like serine/threonine-protein kinase
MIVGDVLADRYRLDELIGSGGMSTVYRAQDAVLGRTVAIKVLHPQFNADGDYVERFRREAQLAAALSHPHIVKVLDRGRQNGGQFIVFEYVDGETLKNLSDRAGPLPVGQALRFGVQVASGLAYAHQAGVVHRDVKPQNVLLNGSRDAKVTDFGIARALDGNDAMTLTGTVLGSSEYISPEQAQGRRVTESTDIYSLGVVLYELLTGEPPFTGDNFVAVALRHIDEQPVPVRRHRPAVPQDVADAVERALAKNPADRFPTMAAFGAELQRCLASLETAGPEADTADTMPPRRVRRSFRIPTAVWVILAGLLVAVAAGGFAVWGGGGSSESPKATSSSTSSSTSTSTSPPATGGGTRLVGVTAYDPVGGDGEHNDLAPLATDGIQATFWQTSSYNDAPSLDKPGVGLVVAVRPAGDVKSVVVTTDTPGFQAVVQSGDSESGPFHSVSASQTVGSRTTYQLTDDAGSYLCLWITRLGPGFANAHVNEITVG